KRRTPQFYLETPLRESGFGIEQGRFSLRLLARLIAAFLAFVGLTDDDPAVYFIVAFIRDDNPAEIVLVAEVVEDLLDRGVFALVGQFGVVGNAGLVVDLEVA